MGSVQHSMRDLAPVGDPPVGDSSVFAAASSANNAAAALSHGVRTSVATRFVVGALGVSVAPFRMAGFAYVPADAEFATALADRLNDLMPVVRVAVDGVSAPVTLGPSVASVIVWSQAAIAAGAARALEAHIRHGAATVVVVRDTVPMPAAFSTLPRVGPSTGDVVVDAGMVREALSALRAVAVAPIVRAEAEDQVSAQGRYGFAGGLAASVAIFGAVGVGGHVALPALALQDAVAPTPAVAGITEERAVGGLPVVYGETAEVAAPYVAARFGSALQVSFTGADQLAQAPITVRAAPIQVAALSVAPRAEEASAGGALTLADSVATVDAPVMAAAPMALALDLHGLTPSFITDVAVDDPTIQ